MLQASWNIGRLCKLRRRARRGLPCRNTEGTKRTTGLTRVEREYVMRRIAEERAGLRRLEDGADDMPAPLCGAGSPLAEREKHAAALRREQRL
jgi:hypothetical protein